MLGLILQATRLNPLSSSSFAPTTPDETELLVEPTALGPKQIEQDDQPDGRTGNRDRYHHWRQLLGSIAASGEVPDANKLARITARARTGPKLEEGRPLAETWSSEGHPLACMWSFNGKQTAGLTLGF